MGASNHAGVNDCCIVPGRHFSEEAQVDDNGSTRRDPKRAERSLPPAWSSPWECLLLILRGHTFRTAIVVSCVVGTVLSGVNEGGVVIEGRVGVTTWLRIATNYFVPFMVASIGYLAPFRQHHRARR